MKADHTRQSATYTSARFARSESDAVYRLASQSHRLGQKVAEAIGVLEDCLQRYDLSKLAISFNGGKDCTVLIHLLCAVILKHLSLQTLPPVNSIYVRCDSPFPQVEAFIELSSEYYSLRPENITGTMRDALARYKVSHPQVEAVVVGTRRTDPHGEKLTFFDQTDANWPQLMRVHPIINWSYADIWEFLRSKELEKGAGVPYCNLYDYGYTSLGSTHDTYPNPMLRSMDEVALWKPAYMLEDETWERKGREGPPQQNGNARSP